MTTELTTNPKLVELTAQSESKAATFLAEVEDLAIITADDYHTADLMLVKARTARKTVEDGMEPVIRPARESLDKLYEWRRNLVRPFEEAEAAIKLKMGVWQEEERRRRREREEAERKERERLLAAQREAERQAREADDARARAIAEERRAMIAQQIEVQKEKVVEAAIAKPVKAAGSKIVPRQTWKIDWAVFWEGVLGGDIPESLVCLNEAAMKEHWLKDRALCLTWPGVELVDEIKIAGR